MGLLATLQDEMKIAMKARDQARLDALRMIVSAVRYAEVDSPNLSDEAIIAVLQKEAKKRREAILAYEEAGRTEALEKEKYELSLIEAYLPKMMNEDEVRAKVSSLLDQTKGMDFGMVMKTVMAEMKGQADGGMVSRIVKELHGNN